MEYSDLAGCDLEWTDVGGAMRKLAIILLIVFIVVVALIDIIGFWQVVKADQPTRFEPTTYQPVHANDPFEAIRGFEVWHDKESGQEFTCVVASSTLTSRDKVSCWPTGRNWK